MNPVPNVSTNLIFLKDRTAPPAVTFLDRVNQARDRAVAAVLSLQNPQGYWWAELESNVTITAEYLMMHRFLGLPEEAYPGLVQELLSQQLDSGGWSLWHGDGGDLSTSVEAYQALKMAGLPMEDPRLREARRFILERGGARAARVFTRIYLALFGQMSWEGIPLLPVEFLLLPPWSGISFYEFSSWSRATMIPLSIIMVHQPVCPLSPEHGVAELLVHPEDAFEGHQVAWKKRGPALENFFVIVDRLLKYLRPAYLAPHAAPGPPQSGAVDPGPPGRHRGLGRHPARHGQFPPGPVLPGLRQRPPRHATGLGGA